MKRVCPTHGYYTTQRCAGCSRDRERVRGSRAQRGYGPAHRAARRALAGELPEPCGYCHLLIQSDQPWVAAHAVDGHPEFGWFAAHPTCNQRAKRGGGVAPQN